MRLNILAIFLVTVAIAIGGIYWKVDHDFFAEKLAWNETQSRAQLAALTRAVEAELEGLTQVLDLSMPTLLEAKRDYNSEQVFSRFQMIAKLAGNEGNWKVEPAFFLEKSSVRSWGVNYAELALKSFHMADLDGHAIFTLLDPQRKPWFLLVANSKVTQTQYAAILPADFLQGIIDRQKGQAATISVVNAQAQVFAHSTAEYVGSLLSEDSLLQQLATSANVSGSGLYAGAQGAKVHGFYERVNNSNLFVAVTTPVAVLMADRAKIKTRFIYLGLGLACLGTLLILLLDSGAPANSVSPTVAMAGQAAALAPKAVPPFHDVQSANIPAASVSAPSLSQSVEPKPPTPLPAEITPMKVPAMPVSTPASVQHVERFDLLFSDRKIGETFAMIDELDAPPHPNDEATVIQPSAGAEAVAAGKMAVEMAPPRPAGMQIDPPQIELPKVARKSDAFQVTIRKPKLGDVDGEGKI